MFDKWRDLYGQDTLYDVDIGKSYWDDVHKKNVCEVSTIPICEIIFNTDQEVRLCKQGIYDETHMHRHSSYSQTMGHLLHKFKCGGLNDTDQCVNHTIVRDLCDSSDCQSRLHQNRSRYEQIDLSSQDLESEQLSYILMGEILSRIKC